MKPSDKTHVRRVGLRWGRTLAALDTASHELDAADLSVLSESLKDRLRALRNNLTSLVREAWLEETRLK